MSGAPLLELRVSEARTRLATLAASALFAGVAGAFYGSYVRVASPDAFGVGQLTLMLSIVLAGGIGTLWGPVAGAFVITLLSEAIANYGSWRTIAIALIIIAVLIFYPGGFFAAIQELRDYADQARTTILARWRRARGRAHRQRECHQQPAARDTRGSPRSGGEGDPRPRASASTAHRETHEHALARIAAHQQNLAKAPVTLAPKA